MKALVDVPGVDEEPQPDEEDLEHDPSHERPCEDDKRVPANTDLRLILRQATSSGRALEARPTDANAARRSRAGEP
jgi:hypothetical protein